MLLWNRIDAADHGAIPVLLFLKNNTNFLISYVTHTHINTYTYEHTYVHHTSMSIFERLNQFDFEIRKVSHQKHIVVNRDVTSH
jgi:hypothetical protein